MKRWTLRILAFLLLGAIVNVAVAWVCAATINPFGGALRVTVRNSDGSGQMEAPQHPFATRVVYRYGEPADGKERTTSAIYITEARGWPALAVSLIRDDRHRPKLCLEPPLPPFALPVANVAPWGAARALPLCPIWSGFAINTAFYAAAMWSLFTVPFVLRQRRRIKRGLCPKCAYPVGKSEVCTECGIAHGVKPTAQSGDDMKRWTLHILAFLLLSAIVNVAVAWGCVLRLPPLAQSPTERRMGFDALDELNEAASAGMPRDWYPGAYGTVDSRFGWMTWSVNGGDLALNCILDVKRVSAGWPAFCVTGHEVHDTRKPESQWTTVSGLLSVPKWAVPHDTGPPMVLGNPVYYLVEFVPYAPIWSGFAINTAFYAAILWGLFAAPFALRRRSRRRRGLCMNCGYDLRGCADTRACPECGATR